MNGRALFFLILAWGVLALLVYPSGCTYNTTAPKPCADTTVEHRHGHKYHGNDTIYVGTCEKPNVW